MAPKTATRCFWHEEKTGSLIIDLEKQEFRCLGCGAKGAIRMPINFLDDDEVSIELVRTDREGAR